MEGEHTNHDGIKMYTCMMMLTTSTLTIDGGTRNVQVQVSTKDSTEILVSESFSDESLDVEYLCHFAPKNPNMDDLERGRRLDCLVEAVRLMKINNATNPVHKVKAPFPHQESVET